LETVSIWHWLIVIIVLAAVIVPFWRIFPRAGMSRWWSLLMVVGPINLILLWVLAFKTWPTERREY
jgi:hypothetical protein